MRLFIVFVLCLWLIVACKDRDVEEKTTAEVMAEEEENKLLEDAIERGFYSIENELVDTDSVEFNNSIASHFSDIRDGKEYKIVKIGEQVWMAENLAFKPESGNYWAYNNDTNNISIYGFLYDWETAKEVCPVGWHLPSDKEWSVLTDYLGGVEVAGTKMKSSSGWNDNGNGTNESGFNAFPSGYLQVQDSENFYSVGSYGYWWSSSESGDRNKSMAWLLLLLKNNGMSSYYYYKADGYSVRCIKD